MDYEILARTRRSVRGYKPDPVPRALIEEIIEVAKRAPSSMNTQPWHVHALTGAPLERVRQRNVQVMASGAKANRDIVSHGEYEGVHRARQVAIAVKLFAAWDLGLGTVVNGQGIMRSEIVREEARIPEDQVIMTCIALGYPQDEFPANGVTADREPNEKFLRFVGFDD